MGRKESNQTNKNTFCILNLTNYEFPCEIIMQLSKNSYTNKGRTYQTLFLF